MRSYYSYPGRGVSPGGRCASSLARQAVLRLDQGVDQHETISYDNRDVFDLQYSPSIDVIHLIDIYFAVQLIEAHLVIQLCSRSLG